MVDIWTAHILICILDTDLHAKSNISLISNLMTGLIVSGFFESGKVGAEKQLHAEHI